MCLSLSGGPLDSGTPRGMCVIVVPVLVHIMITCIVPCGSGLHVDSRSALYSAFGDD